jgi:serine/threonine protein kinase
VFLYSADHNNPEVIMKMGEIYLNFTIKNYEFMRMEGTTNAILAPHPLVVDMYGFCSFSMFSEAVMGGDIDEKAVPFYDRHKHCEETFDEEHLLKLNSLHPTTKLEWALDMAEAVALLHNHERGLIIHDDIQLVQFLLDKDGHLKMSKCALSVWYPTVRPPPTPLSLCPQSRSFFIKYFR